MYFCLFKVNEDVIQQQSAPETAEEAPIEQAKSWIDDKFPNGHSKHNVIYKEQKIVELIYNPMGNPYG